MNVFKTNINSTKAEDYTRRKQQVQLLNILDKCTQVLRDDRIWLRNKIKEVDPDVVQIFKKYLSKRPPDLSSLQVNLRKHVMKIKDRCKKEQLQKFKENLNNATCNALFERQNASYERSSKSIQARKGPRSKIVYQEEDDKVNNSRNYNRSRRQYKPQQFRNFQEYNNRTNSQFQGLKMTDPIHQQQQIEQVFSYRSKSEFNKAKLSYRMMSEKVEEKSSPFPWLKQTNNFMKKQRQLELDIEEDYTERQTEPAQQIYKKEIPAPNVPFLSKQKNIPFVEQAYQIQESQVQSHILNSQLNSHANSNLGNSGTYFANDNNSDTFAHQFKIELNCNGNSVQPPSFSGTPAASSAEKNILFSSSYNIQVLPANVLANPDNKYPSQEQQLFTDPNLLAECKKILQQSRSASQNASKQSLSNSQNKASLDDKYSHFNREQNYMDRLALKAKSCNSQTKVTSSINNPVYLEKYQVNPLPYLGVVESFERDEEEGSSLIPDITKLYAQDVFDIIFPIQSTASVISLKSYQKIVSENFFEKEKLMKLFKLGDKNMSNALLATQFGRLLLTNCNYKPSPNSVKQIFSLIDIDRKGYFTLDDYERFLEQVIDSEDPDSNRIIDICQRLFQKANISRSERIEYWGLYLTKNSNEFKQFSTFLEQFEFEFEVV